MVFLTADALTVNTNQNVIPHNWPVKQLWYVVYPCKAPHVWGLTGSA